jgi:hypothetical protein
MVAGDKLIRLRPVDTFSADGGIGLVDGDDVFEIHLSSLLS